MLSLTVLLCASQAQEAEEQSEGNGAFTPTFKRPPGFSMKEVPTAASHLADQARDSYLLRWTTDSSIVEKHRWGGGKSGKLLFTFPSLRAELLRLKKKYGPDAAIHLRALEDWSVARIKSTAQPGGTLPHVKPRLRRLLLSSLLVPPCASSSSPRCSSSSSFRCSCLPPPSPRSSSSSSSRRCSPLL